MWPKYLGRRNGDHECACVQVDYEITWNPCTYMVSNEDKISYK